MDKKKDISSSNFCATRDDLPSTETQKKQGAYLLLFLSPFNINSSLKKYKCSINNAAAYYEGEQTNDAPVQCLLDLAKKDGNEITNILCISSKKVMTNRIPENSEDFAGHNAFSRFLCVVKKYIEELKYDNEVTTTVIPYDFKNVEINNVILNKETLIDKDTTIICGNKSIDNATDSVDINENSTRIFKAIQTIPEGTSVYIDYTGGLRDTNFLMVSIIRYLEIFGRRCKKTIYSNVYSEEIVDIEYIYNLFNLINGFSDFMNSGNPDTLTALYSAQTHDRINLVLNNISEYVKSIHLCALDSIDAKIEIVSKSLEDLSPQISENNNLYDRIFNTMIGPMINKLHLNELTLESGNINYPILIEWCCENGLLQQAITLYNEKMPKYYIENNYIEVDDSSEVSANGKSKYKQLFWEELYNRLSSIGIDPDIKKFQNKVKTMAAKHKSVRITKEKFRQFSCTEDKLKKAFDRMNIILGYYNRNGIKKEEFKMLTLDGISLQNDMNRFIESIYDPKDKRYAYYLVYGKKPAKEPTLIKKIVAINKLKSLSEECDNKSIDIPPIEKTITVKEPQKMVKQMAYYLALTIIRNNVNHASEENDINDEEKEAATEAIKGLKKFGIDIKNDRYYYNDIKKIIEDSFSDLRKHEK